MTTPDPYPETRRLPRVTARPAGHLPTTEAPFVRPVPGTKSRAPSARPGLPAQELPIDPVRLPESPREPERGVPLDTMFSDDPYPDPRSRNPLHRYGPQIFVAGALALLGAILLVILRVTGHL